MNLGDLHKVWEVKPLKRKPGMEEAKVILEKIARQVQPIMRKRKWRVKILSEFFPNNRCLLGLNVGRGVHVKLRLRRPNRESEFLPFDQVLDTMLHELCHNVHGPHNASFYNLWDELRKECEELMSTGIIGTAEGFDLPGRRLGGISRQPPLSSLWKTALAAAENRARLGSLLPSGPKRLGGDSSIMAALTPVQAAAMAAERRLQDEIWCGSHSIEVAEDDECCSDTSPDDSNIRDASSIGRSKTNHGSSLHTLGESSRKRKREQNKRSGVPSSNNRSASSLIDLSTDVSGSATVYDYGNRPPKQSRNSHDIVSGSGLSASSAGSIQNHVLPSCAAASAKWECATCTLLNPPLAPVCELCGAEMPRDTSTKHKLWFCKFCTLENSVKLDKCAACDQWRYSQGHPISTPAPNPGT